MSSYFGGSFGSTLSRLGQVAGEVSAQLPTQDSINSVASNIGQAIRANIRGKNEAGLNDEDDNNDLLGASGGDNRRRTAGATRRSSTSSSSATTPGSEKPSPTRSFASSFMGAGGIGGFGGEQQQQQESAMGSSCEQCGTKFGIFSKKRSCSECRTLYCGSCTRGGALTAKRNTTTTRTANTGDRTCVRCRILLTRPPVRAELMTLRVKDLQMYLGKKSVNTKACVEKKDLVELVIRANGGVSITSPTSPQAGTSSAATSSSSGGVVRGRDPIERQKSFPKNYSESRHRSEWFENQQRMTTEEEEDAARSSSASPPDMDDIVRDFVVVDRPQGGTGEEAHQGAKDEEEQAAAAATPIQQINLNCDVEQESNGNQAASSASHLSPESAGATATATSSATGSSSSSGSSSTSASSSSASTPSHSEAIPTPPPPPNVPSEAGPVAREQEAGAGEDEESKSDQASGNSTTTTSWSLPKPIKPSPVTDGDGATAASASPRRFANQGLVYIEELQSESDLEELSVKQIKEVLAMNRVNFKGVVEKDELLRILRRLWADHEVLTKEKDAMEDTDLCKICMDNPVDCVMLECGHMCTCTNCGKQMAECPICRQYVVRVVRTFKS